MTGRRPIEWRPFPKSVGDGSAAWLGDMWAGSVEEIHGHWIAEHIVTRRGYCDELVTYHASERAAKSSISLRLGVLWRALST